MGYHVRDRGRLVSEFVMIERRALRQQLEALIEHALDLLDSLDPDADLEPDADGEDEISHLLEWRVQ